MEDLLLTAVSFSQSRRFKPSALAGAVYPVFRELSTSIITQI